MDSEFCCQGPGVLGPGSGTSDADGPAIGQVMTNTQRPFRFVSWCLLNAFLHTSITEQVPPDCFGRAYFCS